jgi:phosphate-selective porin OprO/OprP
VSANRLLHFGVSGFHRDVQTQPGTAGTNAVFRPRAQPEYAVDTTRTVDTLNLGSADTVNLLGLEAAGFIGPVGFQSEWAQMDVSQNLGRPDLEFSGAYVNANWFITGESRVYDARTGVFTRFSPKVNLDPSSGTWGAWELAARWSTIDLNSAENTFSGATLLGARGGEETNYTLGLNWYWNPYLRLMLNATHADVDNFGNALVNPANESTELNLYSLRVQQEW